MESVLLVDDEKDNLEALRRLLRQEFDVTVTESGADALKLLQSRDFAVVVSDQRMPQITGVDLLEKAKQIRPATTRVLLTGYTEIESVIGAINRGNIYRYIAKPWDPEELKITVRQAAESYRLKRDIETKNAALETSNRQLHEALDRLTLLDQAKARFLSLVSHELNTPLTVVTAFVELLKDQQDQFSPDVQKALVSLQGASGRLSQIIEDVLTYVRLEAEGEWKLAEFDWQKEIAALAPSFKVDAKKPIKTQCAVERTRLALSKIIEEARGYATPRDSLRLALRIDDERVCFRVEWRGEPLPPQALEAFEIVGNLLHHRRNLGLGLAIAKRVAQRQGGDLTSPTGELACLEFVLPRSPVYKAGRPL